jgi:hypothetical protein
MFIEALVSDCPSFYQLPSIPGVTASVRACGVSVSVVCSLSLSTLELSGLNSEMAKCARQT